MQEITFFLCIFFGTNLGMRAMGARYNKTLVSSESVINCFPDVKSAIIRTQKRLFFHICVQAARDAQFNPILFRDLIHDINNNEDTLFCHPIETIYVQLFFKTLAFIPWNGETDEECGVGWHKTMMNDQFVNLGFFTSNTQKKKIDAPTKIYIFANNEDDFDSEMDHREKIEGEFKEILKKAS